MENYLEYKMVLIEEPESTLHPSWSISEIRQDGAAMSYVPWGWNLSFSAVEIELIDHLKILEATDRRAGRMRQDGENSKRRSIRAKLRPSGNTVFKMFGTDRIVEIFGLSIECLASDEDVEECVAYGWVSYDYSYAFVVKGTDPDTVGFTLMVRPSTFERFAKRIVEGSVDTISLVVGIVDGFYATWSPVDVRTSEVKVLARGKEQVIEDPTGSGIEPPRLGKIYDANIYFIAKRELPVRGAC